MSAPAEPSISIELTPAQVERVVRAASGSSAPGIAALVSGALRARNGEPAEIGTDRRLSRSLLRGLSLLGCFESAEQERGIVELAQEAQMSASTAHRYALTLIELGLIERSPRTRRYRLVAPPG